MAEACPDCGVHPAHGHLLGCPTAVRNAARQLEEQLRACGLHGPIGVHVYFDEQGHVQKVV